MKPFDERFADKVREVFDHHEEPFDEAAWQLMQGRLAPQKKPRVVVLWPFLSRAAVVLLLIGGMAFLYSRMKTSDRTAEMATVAVSEQGRHVSEGAFDLGGSEDTTSPAEQSAIADQSAVVDAGNNISVPASTLYVSQQGGRALDADAKTGQEQTDMQLVQPAEYGEHISDTPGRPSPERGLAGSGEALLPAESSAAVAESLSTQDSVVLAQSRETDGKPVYSDYVPLAPVTSAADARGGNNWSVVAGSMMTYAEQQLAGGLGFTGGLMHEWRASDRIRLSSGLLLAYQQFDVSDMPLRHSKGMMFSDMDPENFSVRAVGNQAYEMLAFDIPLNIQVRLAEQRNKRLYVTAGISSLLYLQQQVTGTEIAYVQAEVYDRQYAVNRTISYASEVSIDASYGAFERFDPARLLNLSVGYEITGSRHAAVVEPFLKYPLGTLSSRNIKMGMGGVSLRYRFGK